MTSYSLGQTLGSNIRGMLQLDNHLLLPEGMLQDHNNSTNNLILNLVQRYQSWWMNLFREEPVHVLIETLLLAFIGYLVFVKRERNWRNDQKQHLSDMEKEELVTEWEPEPLVAASSESMNAASSEIVIHKVMGNDFLGMGAMNERLKEDSRATMNKYGCGSCGPRGFYGTIDVHLELEDVMKKFCGTDDAIMYSDGASAVSSAVAAFAKRGDLLVVDEGVYESLQTGVTLSRSSVKYFKHNDMTDLRRVLERIDDKDKSIGRKSNEQRRFIIVEGLYKNYGDLAPIDEIVRLKQEFGYRLIVDESFSFGSVGNNGKGAIDLHGMKVMDDVEIVTISLENAIASVGGICIGDEEIVDHQRLSGAGYCFSASAPPFTASAAIASIRAIQDTPELMKRLSVNRETLLKELESVPYLVVISDRRSCIVFMRLKDSSSQTTLADEEVLYAKITGKCLDCGVMFISTEHVRPLLHLSPPPSIRITVTAAHTKTEIRKAVKVLSNAVKTLIR